MNAADISDKISNDLEIDQAFKPSNCSSQKRNEDISPSKKRRRKGLGTGYLFCKPIVRNNKEYPQWWYQWEEKKEGKWTKRTAFVSKKSAG